MVYARNVVWTTGKRMKNIPVMQSKNVSSEHIHEAEYTTVEKKTKSNSVRKQPVSKKQTQHSEVKNIKAIFYGAAVLLVLVALFLS